MKRLLRWAIAALVLLACMLVAAILSLDPLARSYAETQLAAQTGLRVSIGSVHIGLLSPCLTVKDLVVYNTADFGGTAFVAAPELYVEYDPAALRTHQLHCKLLRIDLSQINIVEDKSGRRNFDVFGKSVQAPHPSTSSNLSTPSAPSTQFSFTGIDSLNLTLGKATYCHLTEPGKIETLDLNVNHQTFPKIKTEQDLDSALIVALLKSGVNLMQSSNSQIWLQLLAPQKK
jgi:uncharacterized protein involved in outer membrane biogenesis